jgi:hypothetical protein
MSHNYNITVDPRPIKENHPHVYNYPMIIYISDLSLYTDVWKLNDKVYVFMRYGCMLQDEAEGEIPDFHWFRPTPDFKQKNIKNFSVYYHVRVS